MFRNHGLVVFGFHRISPRLEKFPLFNGAAIFNIRVRIFEKPPAASTPFKKPGLEVFSV
jgi:hypothetical protein